VEVALSAVVAGLLAGLVLGYLGAGGTVVGLPLVLYVAHLRLEDTAAYLVRNPLSPLPPLREILRVAEHGDGWGTPQQWDPA
jgi:hypothetical protein